MIIRRKYPSQKEFGITDEIGRHGFKKVYKKYVGRARKLIGDRIARGMRKDIINNQRAGNRMEFEENTIVSPRLSSKLQKKRRKRILGLLTIIG